MLTKEQIKAGILAGELEKLVDILENQKPALRYLLRLLCSLDNLVKWRTVETLGLLGSRWLDRGRAEETRILLRKFLWTLNDESGGIGWGSPECIGEIVSLRPQSFAEFAPVLLTYTEEEILLPSVIWGGWRIARLAPKLVQEFIPDYRPYLQHPNPEVRGYTWLWLREAGADLPSAILEQDDSSFQLYADRQIREVKLKDLLRNEVKK